MTVKRQAEQKRVRTKRKSSFTPPITPKLTVAGQQISEDGAYQFCFYLDGVPIHDEEFKILVLRSVPYNGEYTKNLPRTFKVTLELLAYPPLELPEKGNTK